LVFEFPDRLELARVAENANMEAVKPACTNKMKR
jgi:hypothetical protein